MATLCSGCPVIRACSQLAQQLEAEGGPGTVGGIWGGEWYRDGQILDPWGTDVGDMRSVYRYVWYDGGRGKWRAEVVRDGDRMYLASSDNEDTAGQKAWQWRLENGDT